ncbi:hypothetical protein [Paenarthrobacter sp. TE4293]|uniref:hypothetical protein n=1 Tax=Paenarthrobacter sp. TE4293 TaxID=3381695 RepID=UPI003D1CCBD9
MVEYLAVAGRYRWHEEPCDAASCAIATDDQTNHHRHMRSNSLAGVRVDLEPVYWADMVQPRNFAVVMWWAFHATLQIFLLHFVSALFHLAAVVDGSKGTQLKEFGHLLRWYWRTLMLSLLSFPCALAAALAMLVPSMRKRTLDALAWTSDEKLRARIAGYVESRIRHRTSDAQVLIGHSQGGSILTSLVGTRNRDEQLTLMTLGSGQGLLSVLNSVPKGMKRWVFMAMWLVMLHTLTGLVTVLPLVRDALLAVSLGLDGLASIGAVIWIVWAAPTMPDVILRSPMEGAFRAMVMMIDRPFPWIWLGLTFGLIIPVIVLVFLQRDQILALAERVQTSCRPEVQGLDLSADHDYVSSVLSVLGTNTRFRKIPQTGSFPMDHLSYFHNGPFVLAQLVQAIECRASGAEGAEIDATIQAARGVHRSSLRVRRVKLLTMAVLCLATTTSGDTSWPPGHSLVLGILVLAAGLVIWRATARESLNKYWGTPADVEGALAKEARRRATLASKGAAAAYALAALPLGGAAALEYGAYSDRIGRLPMEAYWGIASISLLGTVLLLIATVTRIAGIHSSLYMAVAGLLLGVLSWSAQGSPYAWCIAMLYLVGAAESCLRLWRLE